MGYWIIDGRQMTDAEYEEHQRQQIEGRERVRREAEALMAKLGQTYEALTNLLEQNPEVGRQVTDRTAADEAIYRKLRRNLEHADMAPRCRWVKQDGTACRSPQIRKHIYCYAHKQMMEARALALHLPALEDANAIQIALMRVQKALIDDTITAKKAGLLFYSIQLAMTNAGQTTFGQAKDEELVTDLMDDEEEALSGQPAPVSLDESLFTRKGAESAEEKELEKALPLMNADHTDHTDRRGLQRMNAGERHPRQAGAGERGWDRDLPDTVGLGEEMHRSFDAPALLGSRRLAQDGQPG